MKRPLTGNLNCSPENGLDDVPRVNTEVLDTMILGRCKHGYHGGYPAGFLERARLLLVGGDKNASIWHIPGGRAAEYNGIRGGVHLTGYGINDLTIDLDPNVNPDLCLDVRYLRSHFIPQGDRTLLFVPPNQESDLFQFYTKEPQHPNVRGFFRPKGIIIDRPYDDENADRYAPGKLVLPNLNQLLIDCLELVDVGSLVGVLDFQWPNPSPSAQFEEVSVYSVGTGRGCRARWFTIWRKR
ncbi:hypothetical protein [Leptospira santarosai]|uniref:Uncharacterized protein n=1 Tax=Leptospira santarosai serovar Shermani str. LT 821 TaxID=758847 RepID=K8YFC5_9LEPT|nr:hypothetical protein [Leptospira santarosai]EKT88065.1 hypothetical protein LSS_03734 [Leptospira santarosai serovar Shermani str. LT 821]EMO84275.1 hypothetical protein LEP1GSC070_3385 [Leptospira santarosai str. AIM]EPG81838.1 hypothetical protein LEP1GSC048_2659 [Leptospira santarosai serovar Shermani str. 1342KT]KXZ26415.1 hypothetical protein AYB33_18180 [Leptospira santarosai]